MSLFHVSLFVHNTRLDVEYLIDERDWMEAISISALMLPQVVASPRRRHGSVLARAPVLLNSAVSITIKSNDLMDGPTWSCKSWCLAWLWLWLWLGRISQRQ
jgi:hypothetical protein